MASRILSEIEHRYFLRLSYDGSSYHGWQRQPNATSVQQTLEEALSTILRRKTDITGAGRTDTGVHAREMFAHFDTEVIIDKEKFLTSLNRLIGNEISVHDLLPVRPGAHARFDATSRSYEYCIVLAKDPFEYRYAHRLYRWPDVERMNQAAELLMDTSDFTSFAKLHSDAKTNICNVTEARWTKDEINNKLFFRITADRFLRNMVRAIVGTLLDVGFGKLSVDGFKKTIEMKDRCEAGMSMPAKGLYLTRVTYPDQIFML